MKTVAEAIEAYGVEIDPHLDRQATIPVGDFVRQGDVLVLPLPVEVDATTQVPLEGVAVIAGENGGNTHRLRAMDGVVYYDAITSTGVGQRLGTLTVPEGSVGLLDHPEHGFVGISPGSYVVNRQREQADEIRMVAD